MIDLYLITPELPLEVLLARTERVLSRNPADRIAIQLRAKHLPAAEQLDAARRLRTLTARFGAPLLVNDRVDVALASNADGVHLPEHGLRVDVARALLPAGARIGVSCHDERGLARAAGASFVCLSPFGLVPGKNPPLGQARFAALAAAAEVPVLALGGIDLAGVPAAMRAGATGIAVVREGLGAEDCDVRVGALLAAIHASRDKSR